MADRVKHYEILEQQVQEDSILYKAWDTELERHVVIKEPLSHLLRDPSFLARLTEEANRLAQIDDENVVRLYSFIPQGEVNDKCYLVLEYVGESLETLMKRGPLNFDVTLNILKDALRGLRAIHTAGLIHANVRPTSIWLTSDGRAKMAEMHMAGGADREGTIPIGSAKYLPHEILAGDGSIGPWSDLYSLGCVGYEMLLGRERFEELIAPRAEKHLDEREVMDPRYREWHCDLSLKARPLAKLDGRIPQYMSEIVALMMEKETDQRYQTAEQVLRDLGNQGVSEERVAAGRMAPHRVAAARPAPTQSPRSEATIAYNDAAEKTRVTAVAGEGATTALPAEEAVQSTFWQDLLVVLATAAIGLLIVGVIVRLS